MARLVDTGNHLEFARAKSHVQETMESFQAAVDEYEEHLREHGCR